MDDVKIGKGIMEISLSEISVLEERTVMTCTMKRLRWNQLRGGSHV